MIFVVFREFQHEPTDEELDYILDKTFLEVDMKKDGIIDIDEWRVYVNRNHGAIRIMTIPYLRELYGLNGDGVIEGQEVREMLVVVFYEFQHEPTDEELDYILDKTFLEVDMNKDGIIDIDECSFVRTKSEIRNSLRGLSQRRSRVVEVESEMRSSFIVKASSELSRTRRQFIAETTAISVLVPSQLVKAEETLSEWERVYLPIDPGVVLLDIAFVPEDPNHGFLLGTRQTLLETKDGGNTWAP
ncbi:hypothetical protein RYX36_019736 [Vicia faba]